MSYLYYQPDNPKATPAQRIADAVAAFARRFGRAPAVVLTRDGGEGAEAAAWVPAGVVACGPAEQ